MDTSLRLDIHQTINSTHTKYTKQPIAKASSNAEESIKFPKNTNMMKLPITN